MAIATATATATTIQALSLRITSVITRE